MATTGTPRRPGAPGPDSPRRAGGNGNGTPSRPGTNGRRRKPKRRGAWQKIKLFFQTLLFLGLIVVIAAIVFLYLQLRDLPNARLDLNFAPPGRTLIFSSDGVLLADLYLENRQVVKIESIPKNLQDATIAFEDKRFYDHQGVDFKGIARSLFQNLKSGNLKAEGGSTITQQLARNMQVEGLTREKSLKRKFKEWVVANQIEKNYTKQDILWMYLNYVNYGAGAFGVQAAAKTYFGKDVSKLDLAQCALLAGLPNRPTDYNPYKNKPAAKAQRGRVLQEMLDQHFITPAQFAHAKAEKIQLAGLKPPAQGSRIYSRAQSQYFTDYVIQQLKDHYGEDTVMAGNMVVYTTLNMKMQEVAERALTEHIRAVHGLGPTQGCLVCLDPKTGEIKALVGGMDYSKSQFDIATQGLRQPGSSFKAIVYSAAIDTQAVTENTTVLDAPVSFKAASKLYTPKDDNGWSYRRVTLREAMAYSINVPAVKVLMHIGPPLVVRYAKLLGVQSPLDPVPSLALGSSPVTPLEMAGVYATFANGGNHAEPTGLMRVDDSQGHVKEDFPPFVETQVLQKSTVTQLDDMLRAVVTEPKGTGAVVADVPEARGKTGTTQGHKDVWFIGYTPNLVCAVWAGHPIYKTLPDGTEKYAYGETMAGTAWGSTVCAPIWRDFMLQAEPIFLKDQAKERARLHLKNLKQKAQPTPKKTTSDHHGDKQPLDNPTDMNAADTPDSTAPADQTTPPAQPADDGSVMANVDDNTGLLAPAGAPHSHREPFARGAQPTVMSPEYVPSDGGSGAGTVAAPPAPKPTTPKPPAPAPAVQPRADTTLDWPDDTASRHATRPNPTPAPRPSPRPAPRPMSRPAPRPVPQVQYVTVRVNPEDGLLATQWDPEQEDRTFVMGREPHRYSRLHKPPPGER